MRDSIGCPEGLLTSFGYGLFLVYCGIILLYSRQVERGIWAKGVYATVLGLLTVTLIGFNEVLMVLVVAMTAGLLIGSRQRAMWGMLLVLAAIAAAIVAFAPGNQVRYAAIDTPNQDILATIVFSIPSAIKNLVRFTLLLLVFALVFDLDGLGRRYAANVSEMIDRWSVRQRWTIILLVSLALFLIMTPGYYGKGKELPGRAQSIIYLMFAAGWWLWVALLPSCALLGCSPGCTMVSNDSVVEVKRR